MAQKTQDTQNWPEIFDALYEKLTGHDAEISYTFEDFKIDIPSSTADDSPQAHWKFNGTMRITTRERTHK